MNRDIDSYQNRQTVITGPVNSGKTTLTTRILHSFLQSGYGEKIAVLDFAPLQISTIGGKLDTSKDKSIVYLTAHIAAPRLMGRDAAHTLQLAEENAMKIEELFSKYMEYKREILFINDVTLYLQAGSLNKLLGVIKNSHTRIINCYYGDSFADSELTRRERKLTDDLISQSHSVIKCHPATKSTT